MKKLLITFFSFLCVFVLSGCESVQNSTTKSGEIIIGGVSALTGDAASYGIMSQQVTDLRLEKWNNEGGVNGKKVKTIWEDGKCNPNDSSKAAQKLIGVDKTSIILTGECSGGTLGMAPITEKRKVLLFATLSTSPEVTNAGDFVFRTAPSDASQGKILAEYANKHYPRIGVLVEQTDYAVAVWDTFKKHYTGEVVDEEKYLTSESDFKTRITKLKNSDINALLTIPQSPTKQEIINKQLQEQGWNLPLIGNEMIVMGEEITERYKDFYAKIGTVGANFITPDSEKYKAFAAEYKERYGAEPVYPNYAATAIDGVDILIKVLREVDDPTDTEAIRDALYAIKDYDGYGSPNLTMDKNGDVNIVHSLFKFDGETFVPLQ